MDRQHFKRLIKGIREAGAIMRGEAAPARLNVYRDGKRAEGDDARTIRVNLKLSQSQFATMLGISLDTLQNWEQLRREPHGPAKVLLRIAATHPEAVLHAAQAGEKPRLKRRQPGAKKKARAQRTG